MQLPSYPNRFCETHAWWCHTTWSHHLTRLCPDRLPQRVFVVHGGVSREGVTWFVRAVFWLVGGRMFHPKTGADWGFLRMGIAPCLSWNIERYHKRVIIFPFQSMDCFLFHHQLLVVLSFLPSSLLLIYTFPSSLFQMIKALLKGELKVSFQLKGRSLIVNKK